MYSYPRRHIRLKYGSCFRGPGLRCRLSKYPVTPLGHPDRTTNKIHQATTIALFWVCVICATLTNPAVKRGPLKHPVFFQRQLLCCVRPLVALVVCRALRRGLAVWDGPVLAICPTPPDKPEGRHGHMGPDWCMIDCLIDCHSTRYLVVKENKQI